MLFFPVYINDIGKSFMLQPVSFFSELDNVTYESLLADGDIPIEITADILTSNERLACAFQGNLRYINVITPNNIPYRINCPVPFREVDLQVFIDNGYTVETVGEKFIYA